MRRRRRWTRLRRPAAMVATAAVVVAVTGVVLSERMRAPLPPAAGEPLRLIPDLPALSADEEQRLQALQRPGRPLSRGYNWGYWDGNVDRWAVPVDCAEAAAWAGLEVPVLPGLDARGYTQVCATDAPRALTNGTFSLAPGAEPPALFRFYLPPGTDLGQVTPGDAAAAGVSWTRITPVAGQQTIALEGSSSALALGSTTVTRTRGDLAVVTPDAVGSTDVTWYEHLGGSSLSASATIAADPVTAVRATLDPHPCDGAFHITRVGSFGGALTPRGALQAWLDGEDAGDLPAETGSRGAPREGWVVVEDRGDRKMFASGDWRVTVSGHFPGTWMVTGKGCDGP